MDATRRARQGVVLYTQVTRSLAHNVGNAVNVVAGRLSLLEQVVPESSLSTLRRTRARLSGLLDDLKGALQFLPFAQDEDEVPLGDALRRLQAEVDLHVVVGDSALADGAETGPRSSELALQFLADACRMLSMPRGNCVWRLDWHCEAAHRFPALMFELDASLVAEDRRALLEPWFAGDARVLDARARYARLLLAQGLGLLEDSGVAVVLEPGAPGCTRVSLVWRGSGERYEQAP